ncbi:hypothetical protein [Microbacterium sp. No. 7]|uniref:hypothetical protein n=1 Tax=Microbacterium sp. No. 7 TaxID=1714373 RepID=UPI0006CF3033|nr:hypothetical protein [Microbacterium sp. No. 7]ALJ19496.1 hypothetical protein AOA12_06080 [Microbacterium sp. No. 7]
MSTEGTYPIDTGTPVGQLRYLVGDTAATNIDAVAGVADYAIWSDDALIAALAISGDNQNRAAGSLYTLLASQYVQLGRSIKTDDLAIDTRHRGKDMLEIARSFYAQADAADGDAAAEFFDIVPLGGYAQPRVRSQGSPWPELGGW